MPYKDLRNFLDVLEQKGDLVRIKTEVDPGFEITEILERLLAKGGPAVIFENVKGYSIPVVANLYGTVRMVALGLECDEAGLDEIGTFLAFLKRKKVIPNFSIYFCRSLSYWIAPSVTPKTVSR